MQNYKEECFKKYIEPDEDDENKIYYDYFTKCPCGEEFNKKKVEEYLNNNENKDKEKYDLLMQAHWNGNAWFEKILLIGDLDIIDLYLKKHVNSQKKYRTFIKFSIMFQPFEMTKIKKRTILFHINYLLV